MILLASIHTPLNGYESNFFNETAHVTWNLNKVKYAERYNYLAIGKSSGFYNVQIGFEKVIFLFDLLNSIPQSSWVWWTGCDTLITNFSIKIEDKLDTVLKINPNANIIMSGDFNCKINSDSILIKNSNESKLWLKYILDNIQEYSRKPYFEQDCMLDSIPKFGNLIQVMPQNFMNSYDENSATMDKIKFDLAGNRGNWEHGDWLLHLAGITWENRSKLVKQYYEKIIY